MGRQKLVGRKEEEELNNKNINPTVKLSSIMVWGYMSAIDLGNLHFINGYYSSNTATNKEN